MCSPYGRVTQVCNLTLRVRVCVCVHAYLCVCVCVREMVWCCGVMLLQVLLLNTKPQAFVEFELADSAARLLHQVGQVRGVCVCMYVCCVCTYVFCIQVCGGVVRNRCVLCAT